MTTVYQIRSLVRRGSAGRHRVRSDTGRRPQYKQRLLGGRVALNYRRPWFVSESVLRRAFAEVRLACDAGHVEICDRHGRRLDHALLFTDARAKAETDPDVAESPDETEPGARASETPSAVEGAVEVAADVPARSDPPEAGQASASEQELDPAAAEDVSEPTELAIDPGGEASTDEPDGEPEAEATPKRTPRKRRRPKA